jgi:hypothetical protein
MDKIEMERYIDKQIAKSKKEIRENVLMEIDEVFIKAAHSVNQNTNPQGVLFALRQQIENKLRMGE